MIEFYIPVLCAHALDTGTDADLDHAALDLVGYVDAGLQTTGTLSVECPDGGRLGEAGDEGRGAHLSGTTARGQNFTNGDVLDEGRVDLGSLNQTLEGAGHQVSGLCVLETTLAALGEGGTETCRNDNLCSEVSGQLLLPYVLAGGRRKVSNAYIVGALDQETLPCGFRASDLAGDLL